MSRLREHWLTVLFAGLAGAMLWGSFGLSRVSGWIPRVVLTATLLLLLLQAVRDLRAATPAGAATDPADRRRSGERAAVAWIVVLLLAVWLLGVIGGSVLFALGWLRWHAAERWTVCLAFCAGFGAALWLVFGSLLGADLYAGLLWGWLS